MHGKDKEKDKTSFKKTSDDKRGAPRANMVCDKEHIQAAQMLEFTRKDRVRSIYTKLMMFRIREMNRTLDTNLICTNSIITTMRIT